MYNVNDVDLNTKINLNANMDMVETKIPFVTSCYVFQGSILIVSLLQHII